MMEVTTETDARYDDIDVESILARCANRWPLTLSRKRCLYQAPEFIKRLPVEETVEEGSTVTFECKVVGFPNPTVTWYKDDDLIGPESRTKTELDVDSGIYSMELADVSKCDAGLYKICASNLEGSSTSCLFIAVKAKAKLRNRKKTNQVAIAPLFPAIVELEAEERKETLEVELQPDSPLTPLYCNISKRSPKPWPAFLGEWAYSTEECLCLDDVDFDIECEDVFEIEPAVSNKVQACASTMNVQNNAEGNGLNIGDETVEMHKESTTHYKKYSESTTHDKIDTASTTHHKNGTESTTHDKNDTEINVSSFAKGQQIVESEKTQNYTSVFQKSSADDFEHDNSLNAVNELVYDSLNNNRYCSNYINKSSELSETEHYSARESVCEFDHVIRSYDSKVDVSTISVNRSYATGDSTFSVAKRSLSPEVNSIKQIFESTRIEHSKPEEKHDNPEIQKLDNEAVRYNMKRQYNLSNLTPTSFIKFASSDELEDNLSEVMLLFCGCTFLALMFDVTPTSFALGIFIALAIQFILMEILKS